MALSYPRGTITRPEPFMTGTCSLQRHVTALLLGSCVLLSQACASSTATTPSSATVMIDFVNATDGGSPALLESLSDRAGASVSYRSAVSPSRHAYRLDCPASDSGCGRAIARLAADTRIRDISADGNKSPIQDNR